MSYWKAIEVIPTNGERLPAGAGVYVIYIAGVPVYVGQSVDIRNRFNGHNFRFGYSPCIHTPWGDYPQGTPIIAKIKLSRRLGDWAMWEIRLISRLRPAFNRHFNGRKRA